MYVRRDLAPQIWDLNVLPVAVEAPDVPVILPEQIADVDATQIYNGLYANLPLLSPARWPSAPTAPGSLLTQATIASWCWMRPATSCAPSAPSATWAIPTTPRAQTRMGPARWCVGTGN